MEVLYFNLVIFQIDCIVYTLAQRIAVQDVKLISLAAMFRITAIGQQDGASQL